MARGRNFEQLFRTVEQLQEQEQDNSESLNLEINHHLIAQRGDAEARDGWTIEREATPEQDDISETAAAEGDWIIAERDDGPVVDSELSEEESS